MDAPHPTPVAAPNRRAAQHRAVLIAAALVTLAGLLGADRWFFENIARRLHTPLDTDRDFYAITQPFWHLVRFFPHLFGGLIAYFSILAFRRMGATYANAALLTVLTVALTANLAQDAISRYRPNQADSQYAFAPPFSGLTHRAPVGFPSGEAATSVVLAFTLSRAFPRRRAAFYTLASLVCLERCLHGKHYLSDVVVGAACAYVLAQFLWPRALQLVRRVDQRYMKPRLA